MAWGRGHRAAEVLVIDDERAIADLIQAFLEDEGYQVATAANGVVALALLEQWAPELPELILLDMRMPEMDGWQFAHAFRQRWDSHTPIVLISAGMDVRALAREVDADGSIAKPFDLVDLLSVVASFVSEPKRRAA